MKLVKVAAGVVNQTPMDWVGNEDNILEAIRRAKSESVSILCLPELCITGYGCEDAFHSPGFNRTAVEFLGRLIPHTNGIVVSAGLPLMYAGGLFNVAALLVDGNLIGFVAKQHLAGDGIHYEPRWFKAWPEGIQGEIELTLPNGLEPQARSYPIGDILFNVGGIKIGFEICEDAWVGSRPGASLAARGADIILNPSASHFAFGKHKVRRRFVIEGSRAFHLSYVYANHVGNESGRAIFDGDSMIASGGELVAVGERLSFAPVYLTTATVDVDSTRMSRARSSSFEPDVDGDESDVISCGFSFPSAEVQRHEVVRSAWESSPNIKCEEFTRAVSLALFDYMRKSRSRGFVLSLSGGADSAACATLIWTMYSLAVQELGIQNTLDRSGRWLVGAVDAGLVGDGLDAQIRKLVQSSLTTAYQATRNSGDVTRNAARQVAEAVGATHYELDVDALVQGYQTLIGEALGLQLNWQEHDIALQNIQARVRAPSIWMLANLNNALLISTSNRSEAAVGYATMDGDTSGGISPIAGIDKAFLREWLRWMEKDGPDGVGHLPALQSINEQQPTAELRPQESGQTDEDDLMPYQVLDFIEDMAIRDKRTPMEVLAQLAAHFPDYPREQLLLWTKRFFRLWSRNQWKRERYAPSFHLDDKNLDPKTWCRFPILSGGFEFELSQLE